MPASYNSGFLKNGWSLTFSASRRFAKEGFRDGTLYDANSFFASIGKKINTDHSLNLTAIYASNIRGKSSPNTKEVFDLKEQKLIEQNRRMIFIPVFTAIGKKTK